MHFRHSLRRLTRLRQQNSRHERYRTPGSLRKGACEASLEGRQHARVSGHPSRPAQERGHLRVNAIAPIPGMTVIVRCRGCQRRRYGSARLARDGFSLNRHPVLCSCLSMISAQTLGVCREGNRCPLFRIMPQLASDRPDRRLRRAFAPDQVRRLVGDHHGGSVEVRRNHARHDQGIDHPQGL